MKTENFYTETETAGELKMVCVDLGKQTYVIESGLDDRDVDCQYADFVAPEIFEAIILGLQAKGYKEI